MQVWKCVWCNHIRGIDPFSVCNAPDGDGHLYKQAELKETWKMNRKKGIAVVKQITDQPSPFSDGACGGYIS